MISSLNSLVQLVDMEQLTDINDMAVINGRQLSQLMVACYHGNPDYVQALLKTPGIKIDLQNDGGHHALMYACAYGRAEVAQLILNAYPNPRQLVNLPETSGVTSLILASLNNKIETVSLLLQYGASINMKDIDSSMSKWIPGNCQSIVRKWC